MPSILPDDSRRPRIVTPTGEPALPGEPAEPGPRILTPPGATLEAPEDLPEYPALRPLEILPLSDGGRDLVLVKDPMGIMPAPVALRAEALELMALLDGTVSLADLTAEVVRGSQDLRAAGFVRDFVAQLDRMLMLDSPRFQAAHAEVRDAYHRLEIRQATLGGLSYPEEPGTLAAFLDEHFAAAERMRAEAGEPLAPPEASPRALLAPHLDPRRAGPAIARAFLELGASGTPRRVVVFGVGHALHGDRLALTRKHFETPFGRIECDTDFVDAVAAELGEVAYRSELVHRDEHSIEFQALYLKRRSGDRSIRMVPILCGGFHELLDDGRTPRDDPDFEALVRAVREAERRLPGPTLYLAGVDLSHVGPRFGDPAVDPRIVEEIEAKDRGAIEAARRGDADGWFQAIAAHEDSTRICGWAATYALLRCAEPGQGRLLRYEHSREDDGSLVSIASMVWP
ncbi:MAG TPA: AmmeMemoRadiSam system protein B [Candidatus Eisenbacteria bacterium]|jgi:hypothetical protein